jgi:uncharacterized membrane protein
MDVKRYRSYLMILTTAIAAFVGWSIRIRNVASSIVAVFVGIVLAYLFKGKVKEVIVDERVHRISEMASKTALQVFAWLSVAVAIILIILGTNNSANFEQAGYTLAYATCALLALYSICYKYYDKKHGG